MRVASDVARRIRDGHPWIFADALSGRRITGRPGDIYSVIDSAGEFVGWAQCDPDAPLVLRVFSRRPKVRYGAGYIASVVRRCAERRRRLLDLGPASCCRVLNGDSEGIPAVTVDRYGAYLVVRAYSSILERSEPELIKSLAAVWRPAAIYIQRRYRPVPMDEARPGAELVYGAPAPAEVVVQEGGARFVVDVTAPMATGLFADMRAGRQAVARLSAGRRVLNCFSYTGAFTVMAALNGAVEVVSIDSASRSHARARRNLAENRISTGASGCEFVTGDTFATLARFATRHRQFDLVILDPPSFSTAKGRVFTALKDYAELAAAALRVLAPGGVLCAASNAAKLSDEDLGRSIGRAAHITGRNAVIAERIAQPPDFPASPCFSEGRYLKFLVVWVD